MKMNLKSLRKYSTAILAAAVLAAGACYSCAPQTDVVQEAGLEPDSGVDKEPEETESAPKEERPPEETQPSSQAPYVVYVCGQVKEPGVYELEPGSRVYQAVEMAGGFGPDAASWYLNLAQEVADGMKIQVPTEEEALAWGNSGGSLSVGQGQTGTKVNLNTADEEQLMTLTGIGESRAADIIRYRQEHGPFERIEDIMNVSGIKEGAFQKIKDSITV